MRRFYRLAALVGLAVCWYGTAARADSPAVTYSYNVLGIKGASAESYVGMFPGDDLLPYTEDDILLEDGGNAGGTWGVAHMDANSDDKIGENEAIFVTVRNDDDDATLYSAMSRPEYGVLYEGEDWVEYWEARQKGPNGSGIVGNTDLTDFEINDWNNWNGQSNAYVYNNLGKNQHGLGLPKYRVDFRNVPLEGQSFLFDEVEGFSKTFGFRNTADDPATPFNENGDCTRFFRPRNEIDLRGYLVPVQELETLADGSLPTLFGWESVDLASYLRDTISPLLDHRDLFLFTQLGLPIEDLLPVTHVYLLQMEIPLDVLNGEDVCGGSSDPICADDAEPAVCQVSEHLAYWGVDPEGSGTFRSSQVLGFNAELVDLVFQGTVHPFVTEPEDGARQNLWLQDHFWRETDDDGLSREFGKYTLIPPYEPPAEGEAEAWFIVPDPARIEQLEETTDQALVASDAGTVSGPLPRALGIAEAPIVIAADLALEIENGPADGDFQIIARSGDGGVVAYADISRDQTQVHIGGTYDSGSGLASSPVLSSEVGDGAEIGDYSIGDILAEYTRFILVVGPSSASLRQIPTGEYDINDYNSLADNGEMLASVAVEEGNIAFGEGMTALAISGTGNSVINTLLVLASPGVGPFVRGDCNQDGSTNISDGVSLLNWLFAGEATPDCVAACSANGDSPVNIASAVFLFNFLFAGGDAIPEPVGTTGYSQRSEDYAAGCVDFSP